MPETLNLMIRIAVADDHTIFRKGLIKLLSKFGDMTVVAEAGDGAELIAQLATADTLPHICILDITMPVMNGYDTASAIRKRWPAIKILALSMHDTELNVIKMMRNGAVGYVLKDADTQELKTALLSLYHRGIYHSDLVDEQKMRLLEKKGETGWDLSAREMQFLHLCCTELTYKEIAEKMQTKPRTIDGYREEVFSKLNIKSRTELVIYAIKARLITIL
jgi:two-component system, NarL family, invasion response regulator UvrY